MNGEEEIYYMELAHIVMEYDLSASWRPIRANQRGVRKKESSHLGWPIFLLYSSFQLMGAQADPC
jgi:hypothetical protein